MTQRKSSRIRVVMVASVFVLVSSIALLFTSSVSLVLIKARAVDEGIAIMVSVLLTLLVAILIAYVVDRLMDEPRRRATIGATRTSHGFKRTGARRYGPSSRI